MPKMTDAIAAEQLKDAADCMVDGTKIVRRLAKVLPDVKVDLDVAADHMAAARDAIAAAERKIAAKKPLEVLVARTSLVG